MTDATILVPTFRHASLLPYAIRSALAQHGASFEIFVVGDGVEDDTRAAVDPFLSDPRVRFFDFPKGQRNGELSRHEALAEAGGAIVCYLSDDDLLLPDHVAEMRHLLEGADFAHSAPVVVHPDGSLEYKPFDVARAGFQALLLRGDWNRISLTGAAHTLDAYRRLPHGWRPAPPDIWSDLYMWQQFLRLPSLRARTASRLTHLHLAGSDRRAMSAAKRLAELERWWARMQEPGFEDELDAELARLTREVAVARELRVHELKGVIRRIHATRWWRLRTYAARFGPVRSAIARRR